MGRLKLLGEPEGGGTDDHSALSNLGYTESGHSGFVPSQGEALIDILRLNQNVIRDSEGDDRITLAAASPHVTLTGHIRAGDRVGIGAAPNDDTFLKFPGSHFTTQKTVGLDLSPTVTLTGGTKQIHMLEGMAAGKANAGATVCDLAGLFFTALGSGNGTIEEVFAAWIRAGLMSYKGPACPLWGLKVRGPMLMFSTYPTTAYGIEIDDQGYAAAASHDAIGLRIADQTYTSGNKRLLELGPATPYLRLIGGDDPPANKSNLYLKFGSTLYRVVKSGSYMTLEAA